MGQVFLLNYYCDLRSVCSFINMSHDIFERSTKIKVNLIHCLPIV